MGRPKYDGLTLCDNLYVEIDNDVLAKQKRGVAAAAERVNRLSASVERQAAYVAALAETAASEPRVQTKGVAPDPPKDFCYQEITISDDFDAGWRACFVAVFGKAAEARYELPGARKHLERMQKELADEKSDHYWLNHEWKRARDLANRRLKAKAAKLEAKCSPPP